MIASVQQPSLDILLKGAAALGLPGFEAIASRMQPASIHLPRHVNEILSIKDDETKVLLAAITASGSESAAYYTPDASGFSLAKHVELYPDKERTFPANIDFDPDSFSNVEAVKNHKTFQLPIYADAAKTQLKGIIVIPDAMREFSHIQNANEEANPNDVHERAVVKKAKLELAQYIVDQHADLFGISGKLFKSREGKLHDIAHKKQYFEGLVKHMFATFPLDASHEADWQQVMHAKGVDQLHDALRHFAKHDTGIEASHVLGVSELMRLAIEKGVNREQELVSQDQKDILTLATILHDVGRTQLTSSLMKHLPKEAMGGEWKAYSLETNHNHPLLSMVMMLLYPEEAVTAASHHHGLFRYTPQELSANLARAGADSNFECHSLLLDDIAPESLPALSKMMRVADVAEAISARAGKPIHEVLLELADKVKLGADGKPILTPETIDPDYLCFMIDNGVFDAFAEQRNAQKMQESGAGWQDKDGQPMLQPEKLAQAKQEILAKFDWPNRKQAAESEIRSAIAEDPLILANQGQITARSHSV